ncbi:DUF6266 family protein [Pedobacter insulae]|uniref:Uncharacterized protein n=1 Tax=Pedobacter insulae TaxID=414048 RepID=A0A1I2ZCC5_9SPHI|nr:DUF6266 family protein [Pedobacter insulae]SFH35512.1 hypothetical protein SAMN04489864_109154 [Pedobacter insulae]
MRTFKHGILGKCSGKIGNLIAYNYRGTQVFRSVAKKSTKPVTTAQQEQRMRFGLIAHFLAPLKSIVNKGYGNSKATKSQLGQCIAYHTKHAVKGIFPDLEIDYGKVVLTTGRLLGVSYAEVFSDNAGCLNFSWIDHRAETDGGTDNVILMVYSPARDRHEFLRTSYNRTTGFAMLHVPLGFSGDKVHCWMAFISENGKEFSASSYLGAVAIA